MAEMPSALAQVSWGHFNLSLTASFAKPACKPFLNTVQPVADSGLCRLHEGTLYISLQVFSQLAGAFKFLFQNVWLDMGIQNRNLDEMSAREAFLCRAEWE